MPRRNRTALRGESRQGIAFIAVILWIFGFADAILGAIQLPANYGVWALALSSLLLLLTFVFDGL